MKKIISIIAFILLFLPSIVMAFPDEESDFIQESEQKIILLEEENNRLLAEDRDDDIGRMIKNAEDVFNIALEVKDKCDSASKEGDYSKQCYDYSRTFVETSAIMKLEIAKYCVYKRLIDIAKKLYRNIITTYVDDIYVSFVEQAKFRLGGLK